MYPERVCPECGLTFTPRTKKQVYHSASCRVKANRKLHKGEIVAVDKTGLLEQIRQFDAQTAADIEDIARRAGIEIYEQVLLVCWESMNRGVERRLAARLAEAEQKLNKRKSRKTD